VYLHYRPGQRVICAVRAEGAKLFRPTVRDSRDFSEQAGEGFYNDTDSFTLGRQFHWRARLSRRGLHGAEQFAYSGCWPTSIADSHDQMKNMVQCLISYLQQKRSGTFAVSWGDPLPGSGWHACVFGHRATTSKRKSKAAKWVPGSITTPLMHAPELTHQPLFGWPCVVGGANLAPWTSEAAGEEPYVPPDTDPQPWCVFCWEELHRKAPGVRVGITPRNGRISTPTGHAKHRSK